MGPVALREYLATTYEPECEYVDGVLLPRPAAGNRRSIVQLLLLIALRAQARRLGLAVRPSLRIQVAPTRVRVPDVCVYEGAQCAEVPVDPPLLTIEVASDTEPRPVLKAKVRDHLDMGTRLAVIVDPDDRSVVIEDADGPRPLEGEQSVRLATSKGTLILDFAAIFAEMDRELSGC